MKNLFNKIFKWHLQFIYFFLKFIPINKNKIVFISRQSNQTPLDFTLIKNELLKRKKYHVVILTKKIENGFLNHIKYYFHIYIQMYHLATSKVCIVDSYCIPVSILKHKKDLTIIQIWHAMGAIKKFGYQTLNKRAGRDLDVSNVMCMHKNYDYILSGSEEMIKYFGEAFHYNKNSFIINGSPKMDYIYLNRDKISKMIKKDYPILNDKINVLYAPTFRKKDTVKFRKIINHFNFDKFNLIIKPHPSTKQKIKCDKVIKCDNYSSLELLTIADYVITDYSAISIEAALLDVPVFLYLYDYEQYILDNGLNIDLFDEFKRYASKDIKRIMKFISANKYDKKIIEDFKNKYVDPDIGKYTIKLTEFIITKTR